MIIVDAVDLGTAPEILVRGPAIIERISPGQIRVSYYSVFRGVDGRPEPRIVAHFVWDREELLKAFTMFANLRQLIEAAPINDGTGIARLVAH